MFLSFPSQEAKAKTATLVEQVADLETKLKEARNDAEKVQVRGEGCAIPK